MAYEDIFNETDALFTVLQNKVMDIGYCLTRIYGTVASLECMTQEFDSFYIKFDNKCSELGLTESGNREAIKNDSKLVFCNILDNISCHVFIILARWLFLVWWTAQNSLKCLYVLIDKTCQKMS